MNTICLNGDIVLDFREQTLTVNIRELYEFNNFSKAIIVRFRKSCFLESIPTKYLVKQL